MILLKIVKSNRKDKKLMAVFETLKGRKVVHFGAVGYSDYISSGGDNVKKRAYIARHKVNEKWDDPMTPATLSRYLLWNKPTLDESLKDFRKRFNI